MVSADAFLWNPETNDKEKFGTAADKSLEAVLKNLTTQIEHNPLIGHGEVIEITVYYHGDQA